MSLSTILLILVTILLGIFSLMILDLNQITVNLDLFFMDINLQLGSVVLASAWLGILVTLLLEIIFFSSKRKNKNE
tara:strand:- start:3496 stop:3723 length:228 start_codon:yes stop_codon:yes gene_type:complete